MRRLLFISPHFPPDSSAGTHRARLLSKWLPEAGWEPTILTVDERDYDSRLDRSLAALVPPKLRVIRVRALPRNVTRPIGFGDLGLRALPALYRAARRLIASESFDAVYVTIYPSYPAVIGRALHARFDIPFILDYQDPWVGAWGLTVGGGAEGRADLRSRVTRRLATWLEPWTLAAASGITAVSTGTYDEVCDRNPRARTLPFLAIPIGAEPQDMEAAARINQSWFDPSDGCIHICYVGTILPLGTRALGAALGAVAALRASDPALGNRLRVHFFGTSNQTGGSEPRVLSLARELGLTDIVTESPARLDYLDALAVQRHAHVLLLLGSTEPHYTPSKLYPALLADRPLLAIYHSASSARDVLEKAATDRNVAFIALDRGETDASLVTDVADALRDLVTRAPGDADDRGVRTTARDTGPTLPANLNEFSAQHLAHRLGHFLDGIVEGSA